MIILHYDPILGFTHYSVEPLLESKPIKSSSFSTRRNPEERLLFCRLFRTQHKLTTKQQRYDDK